MLRGRQNIRCLKQQMVVSGNCQPSFPKSSLLAETKMMIEKPVKDFDWAMEALGLWTVLDAGSLYETTAKAYKCDAAKTS